MTADLPRIIIVLILATAQFAVSSLLFGGGDFESLTADGPIAAEPDLALPAGYAFIIWLPIYLVSIIYGVIQALPSQRSTPFHRKTGWWMALCFASVAVWLIFARFGPAFMTFPVIIVPFLAVSVALVVGLNLRPGGRLDRYVVLPLMGVFAGWLTAATVLNATNVLPEYGISFFGLGGVPKALFTLACASAIALVMLWQSRGYIPYVLTLIWAQVAIIVANVTGRQTPEIAIASGIVIVAILGAAWLFRNPGPARVATR